MRPNLRGTAPGRRLFACFRTGIRAGLGLALAIALGLARWLRAGLLCGCGLVLAAVVCDVPPRALELKRSVGDEFSNFAFAGGAAAERVIGDFLGYLEVAAFLTTVFVDGHANPRETISVSK